ncbi:Hypothetical_protein [Hexamita inflata]|uniref:Hypothetical_protein n=1 Tax=Hexamita inflata TaxID=28002 RepID=A0ABP1GXW6_9EUKA
MPKSHHSMSQHSNSQTASTVSSLSDDGNVEFFMVIDSIQNLLFKLTFQQILAQLVSVVNKILQIYLITYYLGFNIACQICSIYPLILLLSESVPYCFDMAFRSAVVDAQARKQTILVKSYVQHEILQFLTVQIIISVLTLVFGVQMLSLFTNKQEIIIFFKISVSLSPISRGLEILLLPYTSLSTQSLHVICSQSLQLLSVYLLFLLSVVLNFSLRTVLTSISLINALSTSLSLIFSLKPFLTRIKITQQLFPLQFFIIHFGNKNFLKFLFPSVQQNLIYYIVMILYHSSPNSNENYKLLNCFSFHFMVLFTQFSEAGTFGTGKIVNILLNVNQKTQKYDRVYKAVVVSALFAFFAASVLSGLCFIFQRDILDALLMIKMEESEKFHLKCAWTGVAPVLGVIYQFGHMSIVINTALGRKKQLFMQYTIDAVYFIIVVPVSFSIHKNLNFKIVFIAWKTVQASCGAIFYIFSARHQKNISHEVQMLNQDHQEENENDDRIQAIQIISLIDSDSTSKIMQINADVSVNLMSSREVNPKSLDLLDNFIGNDKQSIQPSSSKAKLLQLKSMDWE